MTVHLKGYDELSLSGASFPSLTRIHSQEEGEFLSPGGDTTSGSETDDLDAHATMADGRKAARRTLQPPPPPDPDDDDGYPTDERTADDGGLPPPDPEVKRLNILALVRRRLGRKKLSGEGAAYGSDGAQPAADDGSSSFLGNVDVADVDQSHRLDDASFLVNADVDEAPDEFQSVRGSENDADSYYNVYASTLSRTTGSTKAASTLGETMGDHILQASTMPARRTRNGAEATAKSGADTRSVSTYSYRRAFDNATLGSGSNFTSTCSALTDEYCYDARRTGMSEALDAKGLGPPYRASDGITRPTSGPVDADTGSILRPSDDNAHEPGRLPHQPAYGNAEHLTRIVSYGEGAGYIDEEAARKFTHAGDKHGCCGWFAASPRMTKTLVLFSVILMVLSVASVILALHPPNDTYMPTESSTESSAVVDYTDGRVPGGRAENASRDEGEGNRDTVVPTYWPTPAPAGAQFMFATSALVDTLLCATGVPCVEENARCTEGTTESCCGDMIDALVCECANVGGNLKYRCSFADACRDVLCETFEPSRATDSPTYSPTYPPTISTPAPSIALEDMIYTTSAVKDSPPKQQATPVPSTRPTTLVPSQRPTQLPTEKPTTDSSTKYPAATPTVVPSKLPTQLPIETPTNHSPTKHPFTTPTSVPSKRPTRLPTEKPTTHSPTKHPSMTPASVPSRRPTRLPTEKPTTDSPTKHPSATPTVVPSKLPTQLPTEKPTTHSPAKHPSTTPTSVPSKRPTQLPTRKPTTDSPTKHPSMTPTSVPSKRPTQLPTEKPTTISPTKPPTMTPTTQLPTETLQSATTLTTSSNAATPARVLTTVTLKATRDTYVNNRRPNRNFGTSHQLQVDGLPRVWSFVAFDTDSVIQDTARKLHGLHGHQNNQPLNVQGVQQVLEAKLRVYALGSGRGIVFALPNAQQWREERLTWNNMDTVDRSGEFRVGHNSRFDAFNWYEIDVTDAFTNSNIVKTFCIKSDSTDGLAYASRERHAGMFSPELVLTFSSMSALPSVSPSHSKISRTASNFVPPGCPATTDVNRAVKEALLPGQSAPETHVLFPSQEYYIEGDEKNYGSDDVLVLGSSTNQILIEFDLGLIEVPQNIYEVVRISLRLFATSESSTRSISLHKLPHSVARDPQHIARDNFRENSDPIAFQVTPADVGRWIDIDVTGIIDTSQVNQFVLQDVSGNSEFARRETCHSAKLVVVTASI